MINQFGEILKPSAKFQILIMKSADCIRSMRLEYALSGHTPYVGSPAHLHVPLDETILEGYKDIDETPPVLHP